MSRCCKAEKCSYWFDSCTYDQDPRYAPCYDNEESGSWIQMIINPHMLKCSCCQNAINRDIVFDEHNEQLFNYCPFCGAELEQIELLNEEQLRIANQYYPEGNRVSNELYLKSKNVVIHNDDEIS